MIGSWIKKWSLVSVKASQQEGERDIYVLIHVEFEVFNLRYINP